MISVNEGNLNIHLQVLLFLRFAQLSTTTLTTYACCFYIGFNVFYRNQEAPASEYFLLFTSLLTALELFLTTSWTITRVLTSSIRGINYRWYIASSSILTLLNWYGYSWLRTVPYLTEYNEGNNAGIYFYADSLEHGTCAINDMAIIAGGLNVFFTFLITIWAIFGHYHTRDDASNSTRSLVDVSDSNEIDYLLPMAEDGLGGLLVMEGCEKD
ncbi:hypothetical protein L207DRAFT_528461 [Hyaloscypha variabilis F]|uniref:Uncharacterized protein n=1 Tax=Hyaloscypha variabilis (strain UAMH 11265 / GT02V1 / F) TaxID=1149755 RepID=A0A2J6RTM9_HYAVF|nr:hypothetical protein L207DRAFT_528461 [Hyaloscypha variabilis F]